MKELPVIVSIFSHIFFNPVLFIMVARALREETSKNAEFRELEETGNHAITFRIVAQTYVLGSILCYGMFLGALFLVLRLFGATHSMDAFIDTQFNYHSPWRQIIVGFMTVNMFLYWAHRSLWLASGMFIFPAYLTCVVAQIVLFFKHLY